MEMVCRSSFGTTKVATQNRKQSIYYLFNFILKEHKKVLVKHSCTKYIGGANLKAIIYTAVALSADTKTNNENKLR